jgi:hypothetical protein
MSSPRGLVSIFRFGSLGSSIIGRNSVGCCLYRLSLA